MSRGTLVTSFLSALIFASAPEAQVLDDIANVHPAWTLSSLRPKAWEVQVGGMEFLPDGRLLILQHEKPDANRTNVVRPNGSLFLIDNPTATGEEIKYRLLADSLREPVGVIYVNGKVYISEKNALNEYTLNADRTKATFSRKVATIPHDASGTANFQEYTFGALYKDGYFYVTTGGAVIKGGKSFDTLSEYLTESKVGCVLKISDANGSLEMISSGHRAADGIAWGPEGSIWITDNQGSYRPGSQLTAILPGSNYGYPNKVNAFSAKPVTPPSLWLVHGEIAQSPTYPVLIKKGLYAGQFLMGDVSLGGIKRAFVEKVNGAWQGAVFSFTGGLEVGIQRILEDSNGVLYVGGFGRGDVNNWGWNGKMFGLQKLTPKPGVSTFEILAIRSRKGGMELEFTKPVNGDAINPAHYSVTSGTMVPQSGYGLGSMTGKVAVPIAGVKVSPDRRKVFLEMNGLKAGTVLVIKALGVRSETAEIPRCPAGWYTLNALSDSDPFPTAVQAGPGSMPADGGLSIRRAAGGINVQVTASGRHGLRIFDVRGSMVAGREGEGPTEYRFSGFKAGLYFAEIEAEGVSIRKPFTY
jgi:hypothetical protein